MLRRVSAFATLITASSSRCVASYGKTALSHAEVVSRFQSVADAEKAAASDELSLLESVEQRIRSWKLSKWEFRVPVLLSAKDKEAAQLQLHTIKTLVLDHGRTQDLVDRDMETACSVLGVTPNELREKSRAWLQEKVAELRWKGETAKAKTARDAFMRLEGYGSRDFRYFERLCCIYGLAKLGTFEDAFSNFVVPQGNSIVLDTSSPFHSLMNNIVKKYPTIDVIFDFLGFNELEGYRASLGRYLREGLEFKYGGAGDKKTPAAGGRLLFQRSIGGEGNNNNRVVLFDFHNSAVSVASGDNAGHGIADFVYVNGSSITLVTIASANRWLRSRQMPHRKQLEGIGRRTSFVLGIPYDQVRVRHLVLPPQYVDRASLDRINQHILDLSNEDVSTYAPWVELYNKELDVVRDADYAELAKTKPQEEWVTL